MPHDWSFLHIKALISKNSTEKNITWSNTTEIHIIETVQACTWLNLSISSLNIFFIWTENFIVIKQHHCHEGIALQTPMMFSTVQDDVCMIMKFLSNSPVIHIAANTHPAVPNPAVTTITCNHNFAVNKWNTTYQRKSLSLTYLIKVIDLCSPG